MPRYRIVNRTSIRGRADRLGRGVVAAAAIGALTLAALPATADAHGWNNGAAIGLGILGGVVAGAAIAAATAPPAYAPPPAYYYPPQGYYSAPNYYYAPQPYYGAAYGYPQYGYYNYR